MKINEIYTAYVAWQNGGNRRPILIIETKENNFSFLKITSKYQNKSEKIKRNYFPLDDWETEGLKIQSYVDIGKIVKLSKENISFRFVGELSMHDTEALIEFIRNRYGM